MKIALAGNPNSGKTTLFNDLTGSQQYVGNWPGVTVEKKDGKLKNHDDVIIQDLPGIYSLSPYTLEEVVSRRYLVNEHPDAIINIIDGTNLERNLYLTTQLLELGLPMVVAINMIDLVRKNGDDINFKALEKDLGCKVVSISALRSEGSKELVELAISEAQKNHVPERPKIFTGSTLKTIEDIEEGLKGKVDDRMAKWFAVKVFERDEKVLEEHNLQSVLDQYENEIQAVEKEEDDDAESIITAGRYSFISNVIAKDYKRKRKPGELTVSDKIDKVVTNRILALPIFAVIIFIMYYISVSTLGQWMTDWVNDTLFGEIVPNALTSLCSTLGVANWLQHLLIDGIVGGVGTVLGFVPQILLVFFFLAILEDCGYMSRVAFIMDRILRKFGLSGKSFIPILIGSGCGVPAIMATRTIENVEDRRMTIMLCTFIPCSAKTELIAMITSVFFHGSAWIATAMYFLGILIIVLSGIALKKTRWFNSEVAPFVMELPAYHWPQPKTVLLRVVERGKHFIVKAGTIIFAVSVIVWFLMSYTWKLQYIDPNTAQLQNSILRTLGQIIAPIFAPLGFGNWEGGVSVLVALSAKELSASTITVLAKHVGGVAKLFTPMGAFSYMLLNLFNPPCIAAMSTIMREMDTKFWGWFAILYQVVIGYVVAFIGYQMGTWLFYGGSFNIMTGIAIALVVVVIWLVVRPGYDHNKASEGAVAAN